MRTGAASYVVNLLHSPGGLEWDGDLDVMLPEGDDELVSLPDRRLHKMLHPEITANPVVSIAWHNTPPPFRARHSCRMDGKCRTPGSPR